MHDIKKLFKNDKTGLVDSFCTIPWTDLLINDKGLMFPCGCEGWLKESIGNILDINSIDDFLSIFDNNIIQNSILNKSYTLCNAHKCIFLQDSILSNITPHNFVTKKEDLSKLKLKKLWLQIDESCNLQCPTCRDIAIIHKNNKKTETIKSIIEKVEKFIIQSCNEKLTIRLVGNGELFASNTLLPWFLNFDFIKYPNVYFDIHTNATLLARHEDYLCSIAHKLEWIEISTDAANAETYVKVRKGGDWNDFLKGMETIKKLKTINEKINTNNSFVVNSENYKDIPEFIKFAKYYDSRVTLYQVLRWSMSEEKFNKLNIFSPTHPEYINFNNLLKTIDFKDKEISTTIYSVKIN